MKRFPLLLLAGVAMCLCDLPASGDTVLFSDLGPPSNPYDPSGGYGLAGTASCCGWVSPFYQAEQFTVAGSGIEAVTEIDLGVTNGTFGEGCSNSATCLNTFFASIWTVGSGSPDNQVA